MAISQSALPSFFHVSLLLLCSFSVLAHQTLPLTPAPAPASTKGHHHHRHSPATARPPATSPAKPSPHIANPPTHSHSPALAPTHHHNHHHHSPATATPPATAPAKPSPHIANPPTHSHSPALAPTHHHHHHHHHSPSTAKPPAASPPKPLPHLAKPPTHSHSPAPAPATMPPHHPHHHHASAPSPAPTTAHHRSPPPHARIPPPSQRKQPIAVCGGVYCKSCKNSTIPIKGAVVKLECKNTKKEMEERAETDEKGYFLLKPRIVTSAGWHKCRVFLVSSPHRKCNVPTNHNLGRDGAPLNFHRPENKTLSYPRFTVGPFFFEHHNQTHCKKHHIG